jgi:outer membrane protein, heavy metal efflux system
LAQIRFHQGSCANLEEQRALLERAQKAARDKLELGMGTSLDVSKVAAELLMVKSEQVTALAALVDEKQALLKLMGRPGASTDFTLAGEAEAADSAADEARAMEAARQQRLDLLAAGWAVEAARRKVAEARGSTWDVAAGVEGQRDSMGDEPGMTVVGPSVNVAVPVFDMGSARVAKARAEFEQAKAREQMLAHSVIREVRAAHAGLAVAEAQVRLHREEILPLAEKNVTQAQAGFDTGELDLGEVLMARRSLAMSHMKFLEHQRDEAVARAKLRRSTGFVTP